MSDDQARDEEPVKTLKSAYALPAVLMPRLVADAVCCAGM